MSGGGLFAFAVRTLALETERVLRMRAPSSRLPVAEDWRSVARAALVVASWAEQCARELEGANDSRRPPTLWFRAVRFAWSDAPRVVGLSFMPDALVSWSDISGASAVPPEV